MSSLSDFGHGARIPARAVPLLATRFLAGGAAGEFHVRSRVFTRQRLLVIIFLYLDYYICIWAFELSGKISQCRRSPGRSLFFPFNTGRKNDTFTRNLFSRNCGPVGRGGGSWGARNFSDFSPEPEIFTLLS